MHHLHCTCTQDRTVTWVNGIEGTRSSRCTSLLYSSCNVNQWWVITVSRNMKANEHGTRQGLPAKDMTTRSCCWVLPWTQTEWTFTDANRSLHIYQVIIFEIQIQKWLHECLKRSHTTELMFSEAVFPSSEESPTWFPSSSKIKMPFTPSNRKDVKRASFHEGSGFHNSNFLTSWKTLIHGLHSHGVG